MNYYVKSGNKTFWCFPTDDAIKGWNTWDTQPIVSLSEEELPDAKRSIYSLAEARCWQRRLTELGYDAVVIDCATAKRRMERAAEWSTIRWFNRRAAIRAAGIQVCKARANSSINGPYYVKEKVSGKIVRDGLASLEDVSADVQKREVEVWHKLFAEIEKAREQEPLGQQTAAREELER